MKSKLRLADHQLLADTKVVEVWNNDEFIAEITGADYSGVRIITKYPVKVVPVTDGETVIVEVKIETGN